MPNPIGRLNREIEFERMQAAVEIKGPEIVGIRGSLSNTYKEEGGSVLSQSDLARLIGASHERTISFWESGEREIGYPHIVTLYRLKKAIDLLGPEIQPWDKYRFLVTPQETGFSPIELLRMQSPAGFRIVMASLPTALNR